MASYTSVHTNSSVTCAALCGTWEARYISVKPLRNEQSTSQIHWGRFSTYSLGHLAPHTLLMRYLYQIDWHSTDDLHHYNDWRLQFAYLEMPCHPERLYTLTLLVIRGSHRYSALRFKHRHSVLNNYEVKHHTTRSTRYYRHDGLVQSGRVELQWGFGYNQRVGLQSGLGCDDKSRGSSLSWG